MRNGVCSLGAWWQNLLLVTSVGRQQFDKTEILLSGASRMPEDESANIAGIEQKLSQCLHNAMTADKDELFRFLQGQPVEILLIALRNPQFDENHLLALLKQRGLPEEIFSSIYNAKRLAESGHIKFALVTHPETPHHIAATLLTQLNVFDLVKICLIAGISPDMRMAAERSIIQRLPCQPLGNKITLARRGTSAVVESILREGIPRLVEACLENPHLKEGSVHQLITAPTSSAETISMVARSGRWKGRPNIRLAILKNPRTPPIWFTLFLPGLPRNTIKELLSVPRLTFAQKGLIRQALCNYRLPK
jgi:CheY-like chemotaxis protein